MTVQPWLLTGPRGKSDARATASTHADSPDGSDATAIVRSQRCRLFDNPSLPTIRVRVRENNVRKWTGRSVVPQGAAVPRGRCRGQTENGHSAHAEGGEPRSALKCAMPQCLARPRQAH